MMLTICLSPPAFEIPLDGDPSAFCALALNFLHEIVENCVILVDRCVPSLTSAAIIRALDKWPHKYRVPAKFLLGKLREQRRFVSISNYSEALSCKGKTCAHTVGIACNAHPTAILVRKECQSGIRSLLSKTDVITFSDYPISEFSRLRRAAKHIGIPFGNMTQEDADERIFGPVIRHATHVKIIDRYIGRSVPGRDSGVAALSIDYQRSLEWICNIYHRAVTQNGTMAKATLEIWCGLESNQLASTDIAAAVKHLRAWESKMQAKGIPNLSLHIKKESHLGAMPHARYLITDQLALLVDRGFEILCSDSQMRTLSLNASRTLRLLRDCEIALLPDSSRIFTEIRRLDNI